MYQYNVWLHTHTQKILILDQLVYSPIFFYGDFYINRIIYAALLYTDFMVSVMENFISISPSGTQAVSCEVNAATSWDFSSHTYCLFCYYDCKKNDVRMLPFCDACDKLCQITAFFILGRSKEGEMMGLIIY